MDFNQIFIFFVLPTDKHLMLNNNMKENINVNRKILLSLLKKKH